MSSTHRSDDTIQIELECSNFEKIEREAQKLKETVAAIHALLNSDGGEVHLCFIRTQTQLINVSYTDIRNSFIRKIEQQIESTAGSHILTSNINFQQCPNKVTVEITRASGLITTHSNLYLPTETQVVAVGPLEPIQHIKDGILDRTVIIDGVELGSYQKKFVKNQHSHLVEGKSVQLKNPIAIREKCTTLADRITSKGNKLRCYVSAFANHKGGHIYYGIRDDGVVEGEFIPNKEDFSVISRKVEKVITTMIWPEQIGEPKRGLHWEIFFVPVVDKNYVPIPSTCVIVIYIAACPGGVFADKPECYKVVEGKVVKMSIATWKKRILNRAELIPFTISRISWSSNEIKLICTCTSNILMEAINNGKWSELKRKTKLIERNFRQDEVKLIVLSKNVIASSRQSHFCKARNTLSEFCKLLLKVNDTPYFDVLATYLEIVLKRNQKSFEDIEKFLGHALCKSESIEAGSLTAAVHLLAATVSSFKDGELESRQETLCRIALEHLQCVSKPSSVTRDMEQKAYTILIFYHLKCILSRDLILPEKCGKKDLTKAKFALTALSESMRENPPGRYRQVQSRLAESVFYYRQSQVKEDAKKRQFLECAFNFAQEAKRFAKELAFQEMIEWSETLLSVCTEALVRANDKGESLPLSQRSLQKSNVV